MPGEARTVDALEEEKVTELRAAQNKAEGLFHEVDARGPIRPGIPESQLNQEVCDLAKEMYGISTYWHRGCAETGRRGHFLRLGTVSAFRTNRGTTSGNSLTKCSNGTAQCCCSAAAATARE